MNRLRSYFPEILASDNPSRHGENQASLVTGSLGMGGNRKHGRTEQQGKRGKHVWAH